MARTGRWLALLLVGWIWAILVTPDYGSPMGETRFGSLVLFGVSLLPIAFIASALTILLTRRSPASELVLLSYPTFGMLIGIAALAWGGACAETGKYFNFQLLALVFAGVGFWKLR